METTYLEYLKLFHNSGDKSGPLFRSFVDNWYGYYRGGDFLNRNGKPKWFNKPNPVKMKNALLQMDFVSENAYKAISGELDARIIKDHAVPIAVLRGKFEQLSDPSIEDIRKFLLNRYKLGVITKTEDEKLNASKLKYSMPSKWDGLNWTARYDAVNIKAYR